jgi:hypothetical protein
VYEGQWSNDLISGKGTFKYTSGSFYVGYWKLGVYHGYGWLVNNRGEESEGVWRDGEPAERRNRHRTCWDGACEGDVSHLCATAGRVKRF